jgi:hypothetical protein
MHKEMPNISDTVASQALTTCCSRHWRRETRRMHPCKDACTNFVGLLAAYVRRGAGGATAHQEAILLKTWYQHADTPAAEEITGTHTNRAATTSLLLHFHARLRVIIRGHQHNNWPSTKVVAPGRYEAARAPY